MNIVLTGFMASGKTEISKAISEISDYTQIDTDEMITENYGKSINEIFSQKGEPFFRRLEAEAVRKAASMDNMVIATGGGAVLNKDNIKELRKNGIIFNLSPDFEVIQERLKAASETRPLLKNKDLEAVRKQFTQRLPFYADCDEVIHITSGKTPAEYSKEILRISEGRK